MQGSMPSLPYSQWTNAYLQHAVGGPVVEDEGDAVSGDAQTHPHHQGLEEELAGLVQGRHCAAATTAPLEHCPG